MKHHTELDDEIISTLNTINEPKLDKIYQNWKKVNSYRDSKMLKTIRDYCNRKPFRRAVFLVGVAHRGSIIEKVKEINDSNPNQEDWDFYWHQNYCNHLSSA